VRSWPVEVLGQVGHVLAPVAQGRHAHFHHLQAVVEIAAEAPGGDFGDQVAVGGGHHAHIHRHFLSEPTGRTLRSSSTRSSLACTGQRQLGDLVEEQGAAARVEEQAFAVPDAAPVKAPLTWPKSSDSMISSAIAAQLIGTKGPASRPRCAGSCGAASAPASSLPVPDSPWISTVDGVGAMRLMRAQTSRMMAESPHHAFDAVVALVQLAAQHEVHASLTAAVLQDLRRRSSGSSIA
jgi:hypothetical protein